MNPRAPEIGPDYHAAAKPGLAEVRIDGETVVYLPDADALHHLDRTATAVWTHVDRHSTLDVVARTLAAQYGADHAQVLHDVIGLAESLWRRGLLAGSTASPEYTGVRSTRLDAASDEPTRPGGALPRASVRTARFAALAHRFEVATNVPSVRPYLDRVLSDLRTSDHDPTSRYELLATGQDDHILVFDGEVIVDTVPLNRALAMLLWHINAQAVHASVPTRPVLHAAAATCGNAALLLPAPPESGKTTVVAGLISAGFRYLTDEAVPIDPESLLPVPYPKALSIDRGSWGVLSGLRPAHADETTGQWQVPATSIREDALGQPAPVRFVIIPRYQPDATTRLEPIRPGAMLVRLADSTFQFPTAPQRNLDVLARLLEGAVAYQLPYADLDDAVRMITDLLDSEQLDVAE